MPSSRLESEAPERSLEFAVNGPPAGYKHFPRGPMGPRMGPHIEITEEQKRQFYHDGYFVIKGAVPKELTSEARNRVARSREAGTTHEFQQGYQYFATSPECQQGFVNMFEGSRLGECLRKLIGPFSPIIACDAHMTPPAGPNGPSGDQGQLCHIDGQMAPPPQYYPQNIADIEALGKDPHDPEAMHKYMSHLDHTVKNPMGVPFWLDPEKTLTIGSFTAFIGVAMSDQTEIGCGQLGVMRGFHHYTEQFFRMQRDSGGPVGYEGPGWPRVDPRSVSQGTPQMGAPAVLLQRPERVHIDGWRDSRGKPYSRITPVVLEEGDAVICLHGLPHTGTANHSRNTRYTAYYRVRRYRPNNPLEGDPRWRHGANDQNDRLHDSSAVTFNYSVYNPYHMTINSLCDCWSDWAGMQDVVASERAKQGARYPIVIHFPRSKEYALGRLPGVATQPHGGSSRENTALVAKL